MPGTELRQEVLRSPADMRNAHTFHMNNAEKHADIKFYESLPILTPTYVHVGRIIHVEQLLSLRK
jgi:hypothetical protein